MEKCSALRKNYDR